MINLLLTNYKHVNSLFRTYTSMSIDNQHVSAKFETVFSLPQVKYIAVINRLKLYHFIGTSITVPSCGLLETMNILTEQSFLAASYIGISGAVVLSLFTYPFRNVIGFLYISEDNQQIKISSVNFWGKRKDRIIKTEDWVPLLELPAKTTDAIFLSPKLSDGTEYKLLVKFGKVFDQKRMGNILE